jgi:hypothetical protein
LADDDMRRKYGKRTGNTDYSVLYEETTDSYNNSSSIENYYLNPNDNVSIEFATVSENSESEEVNIDINGRTAGGVLGQTHFTLDPIDEGTVDLVSNTEFFNVRMYEDTESGAIIYYPVYGDTNTQLELDTHVMA